MMFNKDFILVIILMVLVSILAAKDKLNGKY